MSFRCLETIVEKRFGEPHKSGHHKRYDTTAASSFNLFTEQQSHPVTTYGGQFYHCYYLTFAAENSSEPKDIYTFPLKCETCTIPE